LDSDTAGSRRIHGDGLRITQAHGCSYPATAGHGSRAARGCRGIRNRSCCALLPASNRLRHQLRQQPRARLLWPLTAALFPASSHVAETKLKSETIQLGLESREDKSLTWQRFQ